MNLRTEVNKPAVTIKEISGSRIPTIPVGTEFIITWLGDDKTAYSICKGLPVNMIWNDEFELLE